MVKLTLPQRVVLTGLLVFCFGVLGSLTLFSKVAYGVQNRAPANRYNLTQCKNDQKAFEKAFESFERILKTKNIHAMPVYRYSLVAALKNVEAEKGNATCPKSPTLVRKIAKAKELLGNRVFLAGTDGIDIPTCGAEAPRGPELPGGIQLVAAAVENQVNQQKKQDLAKDLDRVVELVRTQHVASTQAERDAAATEIDQIGIKYLNDQEKKFTLSKIIGDLSNLEAFNQHDANFNNALKDVVSKNPHCVAANIDSNEISKNKLNESWQAFLVKRSDASKSGKKIEADACLAEIEKFIGPLLKDFYFSQINFGYRMVKVAAAKAENFIQLESEANHRLQVALVEGANPVRTKRTFVDQCQERKAAYSFETGPLLLASNQLTAYSEELASQGLGEEQIHERIQTAANQIHEAEKHRHRQACESLAAELSKPEVLARVRKGKQQVDLLVGLAKKYFSENEVQILSVEYPAGGTVVLEQSVRFTDEHAGWLKFFEKLSQNEQDKKAWDALFSKHKVVENGQRKEITDSEFRLKEAKAKQTIQDSIDQWIIAMQKSPRFGHYFQSFHIANPFKALLAKRNLEAIGLPYVMENLGASLGLGEFGYTDAEILASGWHFGPEKNQEFYREMDKAGVAKEIDAARTALQSQISVLRGLYQELPEAQRTEALAQIQNLKGQMVNLEQAKDQNIDASIEQIEALRNEIHGAIGTTPLTFVALANAGRLATIPGKILEPVGTGLTRLGATRFGGAVRYAASILPEAGAVTSAQITSAMRQGVLMGAKWQGIQAGVNAGLQVVAGDEEAWLDRIKESSAQSLVGVAAGANAMAAFGTLGVLGRAASGGLEVGTAGLIAAASANDIKASIEGNYQYFASDAAKYDSWADWGSQIAATAVTIGTSDEILHFTLRGGRVLPNSRTQNLGLIAQTRAALNPVTTVNALRQTAGNYLGVLAAEGKRAKAYIQKPNAERFVLETGADGKPQVREALTRAREERIAELVRESTSSEKLARTPKTNEEIAVQAESAARNNPDQHLSEQDRRVAEAAIEVKKRDVIRRLERHNARSKIDQQLVSATKKVKGAERLTPDQVKEITDFTIRLLVEKEKYHGLSAEQIVRRIETEDLPRLQNVYQRAVEACATK